MLLKSDKWTSRSQRSPTGASLRLAEVTSSSFHFYLIDCKVFLNLHEGFNLLQVGYCSWLLLLCLITLYLVTGLWSQDATFRYLYIHIIFPRGAIACLHINCLQEPDPGIILPVMSLTIISFLMVLITIYSIPNKWKMLQVFYTGGSKVSLHNAPTSSSPCVASSPHCDVDPGFTFLSRFVEKDCAKLSGSVWTLHAARSGLIGNLPSQWGPGFQKISKFCKTHVKTCKKLSLE